MIRALTVLLLLLCVCQAQTTYNTDGSFADVMAKIALAVNGDTVRWPASGSFGYDDTQKIIVSGKSIILDGNGSTIIDEDDSGTSRLPIITMNLTPNETAFAHFQNFICAHDGTNEGANNGAFKGFVSFTGDHARLLISNVTFNNVRGLAMNINGPIGVGWDISYSGEQARDFAQVLHREWNGTDWGHGSWQDDPPLGSINQFYFEECTLSNSNGGPGAHDQFQGGRCVFRFSELNNYTIVVHGTEGQGRGSRSLEEYHNIITFPSGDQLGQIRSGTIIQFNNTYTNLTQGHVIKIYRKFHATAKWYLASGESTYDLNEPDPTNGWYFQGIHDGANGATVFSDAGATMTPDEFIAAPGEMFMLVNKTREAESNFTWGDEVIDNTGTTITTSGEQFGSIPRLTWNAGDVGEVHKVLVMLDQTGRGKSAITLTGAGNYGTGSAAQPAVWPDQAVEPSYSWGNTNEVAPAAPAQLDLSSQTPTVLLNRDYFNQVADVNGSAGVQVGTLAQRNAATPATINSAFWVTDQGEWWAANAGADGRLDIWNGSTWGVYYTPLAYPHPWRTASADTDPPTPTPMTFAVNPAAVGPSAISFTATTASDATTPILYQARWDETGLTAWTETGEQGSTSFTVSELVPDTAYDFQVRARDANSNYTAWSSTLSATTNAAPTAPPATVTNLIITTLNQ